ncbi:MAG: FecR domain-containing protein [Steroidobacteraceae bacterium]|nr:FecR domain-containing protein [Steroidobacteraceae bacterium]
MHDDDIERVLKAAGPREQPPAEIERELRESLRREWLAVVAERRGRRRTAVALAAGVMAATVGAWIAVPQITAPAPAVGTIAQVSGELRVRSGWLGRWQPGGDGRVVTEGEILATGPSARGALALAGGISARLDQDTQLRVAAADRLVIDRGAIYVDAGIESAAAAPLEIVTPTGSVRHLGTQYEVRVLDDGLRLRVREGRIEWHSGGTSATGVAGEELTIGADGSVGRGPVAIHGEAWDWAMQAAPAIDIEGLPLAGFLGWAARELGCRIEFSTQETEREAAGVILHGTVAGLPPARALEAVFATTRLRAVVLDGRILVSTRE